MLGCDWPTRLLYLDQFRPEPEPERGHVDLRTAELTC